MRRYTRVGDSYTKLFSSILDSSVWSEDKDTKILWITMLAKKDINGDINAAVPGLAKAAGLTIPECEAALEKLMSPDPHSKTPDYEGRRVLKIDDRYKIVNHEKYRNMLSPNSRADYHRERRARIMAAEKDAHPLLTITPDNDPDLNPGQTPIVRSGEQTGEVNEARVIYGRIVVLWNSFAKKKADPNDINTESAVVLACGMHGPGQAQFIAALENYRVACEHPQSQAWAFNLYRFCVSGHKKFLPGVFDIDNYDKSNFNKQSGPSIEDRIKGAMEYK
jgi:hypothetical protein